MNIKHHIQKKTTKATRTFFQIKRLANTERGLSSIALRQLYLTSIASIVDYGVQLWWKGQKTLIKPYQDIQNKALRCILGAFKTSPIRAMEIEANIPPVELSLDRLCLKYALKTLHNPGKPPIQEA